MVTPRRQIIDHLFWSPKSVWLTHSSTILILNQQNIHPNIDCNFAWSSLVIPIIHKIFLSTEQTIFWLTKMEFPRDMLIKIMFIGIKLQVYTCHQTEVFWRQQNIGPRPSQNFSLVLNIIIYTSPEQRRRATSVRLSSATRKI